jgi:hypothetical protein
MVGEVGKVGNLVFEWASELHGNTLVMRYKGIRTSWLPLFENRPYKIGDWT